MVVSFLLPGGREPLLSPWLVAPGLFDAPVPSWSAQLVFFCFVTSVTLAPLVHSRLLRVRAFHAEVSKTLAAHLQDPQFLSEHASEPLQMTSSPRRPAPPRPSL